MHSALIGEPPNTEEDFYIVRGILRRFGLDKLDPALGAPIPPLRPPNAHFETRGPSLIAVHSICIVLLILITGSRLLIRGLHRGVKWGWDDWVIIPGAGGIIAWFALGISVVMYGGGGKHIWSVTYHEFNRFQHLDLVRSFLYLPSACVVKISIVLFNRRITGLASKHWRWFNDGFLALLVIYLIAFTVWISRNCATAIETFLNAGRAKSLPKCDGFPATRVALGLGVAHVVLDFCLLCTPIIVLWKIQMDRSKKVRPFIALLIGAISCVGALMIRVTTNQKHTDIPWNYIELEKWVLIDLFFGLLVASLPVLQGQLPRSWGLFKAYAHSHNHSHRSKPLPGSTAGTDRPKQGIYHQYDLESKSNNFRSDVDDEIELLAQGKSRPPADGHQPPMVFITAGDVESKTSKASKTSNQQSRDESPD